MDWTTRTLTQEELIEFYITDYGLTREEAEATAPEGATGHCALCGKEVPLTTMPEGDVCNKHDPRVAPELFRQSLLAKETA